MAKFIKLTETRRGPFAVNVDTIEAMLPFTVSGGGTVLYSNTHQSKYTVKEDMDDILKMIHDDGETFATKTNTSTEVT